MADVRNYLAVDEILPAKQRLIYKTSTPIIYQGTEIGWLYLGLSLIEMKKEIEKSRKAIAYLSLIVFVLGMIGTYGISYIIVGPLEKIVATTSKIADGDLTQRANISTRDEIGNLAKSFNKMVESLEATQLELKNANLILGRHAKELQKEVNERKRVEEKLKIYAQKLERSNQELQDFAYVASHDLQEPLRKIRAFGDRLKSKFGDNLTEQGIDYLERMQNAAARMQNLINGLLSYSRITTKAQPFVPVNLYEIAQEVISDLEIRIEEFKARVEVDKLRIIDADPLQMRQLLQNLIGNALKFHRPGVPPVVKVSGEILSENGTSTNGKSNSNKYYEIRVEDNGIGFDEKYLDKIFGVFQRLHGRNSYEGTGVGLAVCRKIAERHEGTITARSIPGKGSTFIVKLPVKNQRNEEA